MKLKAILTKSGAGTLAARLPALLAELPKDEAYTIHQLGAVLKGYALGTLRSSLSHIDKDQFMVRVGRDHYYGNPVAIAALKEDQYGKSK